MKEKIRVGVFGGTFNPPHIAHVRAAESFKNALELDKLLIIPDYLPPHKELVGNVTPEHRLAMCELAFGHISDVTISDMEIKRGGRSYTAQTLSELASNEAELYFLCGTDMFLTLDTWYRPDIIFNLASICYIRRESDAKTTQELLLAANKYRETYGARIFPIEAPTIEASSTEIRTALYSDVSHALLQESVYNYITEMGLYKHEH